MAVNVAVLSHPPFDIFNVHAQGIPSQILAVRSLCGWRVPSALWNVCDFKGWKQGRPEEMMNYELKKR
jgi:hypothetical protein